MHCLNYLYLVLLALILTLREHVCVSVCLLHAHTHKCVILSLVSVSHSFSFSLTIPPPHLSVLSLYDTHTHTHTPIHSPSPILSHPLAPLLCLPFMSSRNRTFEGQEILLSPPNEKGLIPWVYHIRKQGRLSSPAARSLPFLAPRFRFPRGQIKEESQIKFFTFILFGVFFLFLW